MTTLTRPYAHYKFPHEIIISIEKLDTNACRWYGVPIGSYAFRCTNYGWFPTEVLMGTIKGKFSDTNELGATISGNLGSGSLAVKNKDKAIQMLQEKGYSVLLV